MAGWEWVPVDAQVPPQGQVAGAVVSQRHATNGHDVFADGSLDEDSDRVSVPVLRLMT